MAALREKRGGYLFKKGWEWMNGWKIGGEVSERKEWIFGK